MKPCIVCGIPSKESRCPDHVVNKTPAPATQRGYDHAWRRLSERARRLQPFCSDCGATHDLQLDHTPHTWQRKAEGKILRLADTGGVVCRDCNIKRGAARGEGPRRDLDDSAGQAQRPSHTTSRSTTEGSLR